MQSQESNIVTTVERGGIAKYVSARALSVRWGGISRSQVARLCQAARIRRISLSTTGGRNGRIAYLLQDIEQYEQSHEF